MFCADLSAQGLRPVRLSRTVNILPSDFDLVNNFFSFFELFFCTFSVQLKSIEKLGFDGFAKRYFTVCPAGFSGIVTVLISVPWLWMISTRS